MKIGDIVRINDGSYAMAHDGDHAYYSISGNTLIADGDYRVIGLGDYSLETDNSTAEMFERLDGNKQHNREVNNVMVQCVKNPERIAYTQKRFCSVI